MWVLFFLLSEFVFLTVATDREKSETFLCQAWNSSPSKSLCGRDRAQLTQSFATFLVFSFLKVVDSHFLSFFFPLFLSASYEDSKYKCNRWSYLQIYKLKEKKYYGWLREFPETKTYLDIYHGQRASKPIKKEQRELNLPRLLL